MPRHASSATALSSVLADCKTLDVAHVSKTDDHVFNWYEVGNVDLTIIAQKPKLAPHIEAMRKNLAEALAVPLDCVSVKAKTNEGMGFTGRLEGLETQAVVLLQHK